MKEITQNFWITKYIDSLGSRYNYPQKDKRGFTLVELMIVILISIIAITIFFNVFISGVRYTIVGQDSMDSTKAANNFFAMVRKDMLCCEKINTGSAITFLEPISGLTSLGYTNSMILTMPGSNNAITYSFVPGRTGKSGYIQRVVSSNGNPTSNKKIGIPRIKSLNIAQIWYRQRFSLYSAPNYISGVVLINIEVASDDRRIQARALSISSFFPFSQMLPTSWNHFFP